MSIERLVILGSTITALAVVRDAHAHGLEPVVFDSADGIAFRSRYATACRLDSAMPDDAAAERLLELGGDRSTLIATGDPWVRFIARHRARLDAGFGAVLHPSNEALDVCLDKQKFYAWCVREGLDTPRSWWPGQNAMPADLKFPVLVRPAQTLHGRAHLGLPKATEIDTQQDLAALLTRFATAGCEAVVSESLLQEGVVQYSVPFARRGGALQSFVARKLRPTPERCAVGTFVELTDHPDVEALGRRAANALDYYGVGEAEILFMPTTGRACLIEINARPWLQYALAPASGSDFLGLLLGELPPAPRNAISRGSWIDLQSDLFGALSSSVGAVRKGQTPLAPYLASLLRANVFARFAWTDPMPALYRESAATVPVRRSAGATTQQTRDTQQ